MDSFIRAVLTGNPMMDRPVAETSTQQNTYVSASYDVDLRVLLIRLRVKDIIKDVGDLSVVMVDDLYYGHRDIAWSDITLNVMDEYKTEENYAKLFGMLTKELPNIVRKKKVTRFF